MIRDAYVAIADPTRREILNILLRSDVAAAGEIACHFSELSRPAVSRHLRVLRECGVVTTVKSGKSQVYCLNPEPLNEIRDGWLKAFSGKQVKSLSKLRQTVEARR